MSVASPLRDDVRERELPPELRPALPVSAGGAIATLLVIVLVVWMLMSLLWGLAAG